MERIAVLGLGNWGTALANHLATKGYDVLGWSIEQPVVEGINSRHRNPNYLTHIELHQGLKATMCLEDVLDREVVVLVVPSFALAETASKLMLSREALIVSAIKGLDAETLLTPLSFLEHHLPVKARLAVLSGPSFAKDIAAGLPCGIVAASKDMSAADRTSEIFSSDSMRVYTSPDPVGVEIGAAVKNVVALAAGICDGIGLGDSARAGVITRGLAEMVRLAIAVGAGSQTLFGLSGLGDLVMTSTCDTSRNRTVGLRLGRGEPLEYILKTLGSVAEGVEATPLVLRLAERHGVEAPITAQVARLIKGECKPGEAVTALMARPQKMEFE